MAINWIEIERLARAHHLEPRSHSEEAVRRFLEAWWCFNYNRPFKDPLLAEYTLDELAYEYLRHDYVKNDPRIKIEADKRKARDDAWIREQLERVRREGIQAKPEEPKPEEPKPAEAKAEPKPPEPGPDLSTDIKFEP